MRDFKNHILILICIMFIQGCFNQGEMIMNKFNLYEENQNSDNPYAWVLEETDKAYIVKRKKIKGEITKNTVAPPMSILGNDVFKAIKNQCGYRISDMVEIRLLSISEDLLTTKEIWVFKDNKSEMKDKTTALTLKLIGYPNNGGTDIHIVGDCPAKIISIYTDKW